MCVCLWERVNVCALCRLDAWFKSFAEGEHFDCNAACCVLKLGPAAPLKLVNCQDWSVKGGPQSERGGESHSGGPARGGVACNGPPGLWGPSVWAATARRPSSQEEEREGGGLKGRCWRIGPCSTELGQDASLPVQVPQTRCSLSGSSGP